MQYVRPEISTLCIGQAASMGSLLLAAGHPGKRFSLPNSRIMLHQPSGGFQGQASDIALHAEEILNLKKRLNSIYVKHCKQKLSKVETTLDRDNFMTAEEAKKFGDKLEKVDAIKLIQKSASLKSVSIFFSIGLGILLILKLLMENTL